MAIIREVYLDLKLNRILRRQGIRGRSCRPEILAVTKELLEEVKEFRLLEPVSTYNTYAISEIKDNQVRLSNGVIIHGELLPSILSKSKDFMTVVCTIGRRLENKVAEQFRNGEPLRGLLLDGIATAAVDTLTVEVCKKLRQEAISCGNQASSPLCPGMPGFPLTEQQTLLKLASAEQIGVSLSSTGIMFPRKSTSAVLGIGPDMPTWTQAEVCAHCSLNETCSYRIHE
jgi:hypothetical protein